MSSTGIAVVIGADYAATLGCGTWLVNRVIDRVRVGGQQQARKTAETGEKAAPVLAVVDGSRPANGRDRYNAARDQNMTPEEAANAAGIAARTAREYEAERRARTAAA